jgi:formate/nitrite transporter FocA (FNT family)
LSSNARMALRDIKIGPSVDKEAQTSTQRDLDRPTANEIYEQVSRNARRELQRPKRALMLSGIVGGLTMGLTGLSVSVVSAQLGPSPWAQFVALLFYPVGFMAVILGRAQLFTENTLYPVALILVERRHVWETVRLWTIVFPSNVAGAFLFALLAARTRTLQPNILHALTQMGIDAARPDMRHIFWSGVVGGWIIAMVAWLVSGSHSITSSVAVIWVLTRPLRALHRNQRRNSRGGVRPRGNRGRLFPMAAAGDVGQYRGRSDAGDAARIRPGETGLKRIETWKCGLLRVRRWSLRRVGVQITNERFPQGKHFGLVAARPASG